MALSRLLGPSLNPRAFLFQPRRHLLHSSRARLYEFGHHELPVVGIHVSMAKTVDATSYAYPRGFRLSCEAILEHTSVREAANISNGNQQDKCARTITITAIYDTYVEAIHPIVCRTSIIALRPCIIMRPNKSTRLPKQPQLCV